MEVVDGLAQPFDRAGDGDTNCQPVGDRVATVRLDGASRAPALVHHRSSFGRDRDLANRCADAPRHTRKQRAVPDRDDHRRGLASELLVDLLPDRRVAVDLSRLVSVHEELDAVLACELERRVLRLVEVRADLVDVGAE